MKESMGDRDSADEGHEGLGGGTIRDTERDTAEIIGGEGAAVVAAAGNEGDEDEETEFDVLLGALRAKDDGEQAAREVFPEWRVAELRKLLRHLGLPVSGNKAVLVDRIVSAVFHDEAGEGP